MQNSVYVVVEWPPTRVTAEFLLEAKHLSGQLFRILYEMGVTVASGQKRVPSIHVLQFADDNGELCFLLVHKEASKAKGEHDPNFPSSVLLAFLLQTSSASCFQWYVCVPHAALATAAAAFSLHV